MTTEDDEYRGYFIPKGTAVVNNVWYVITKIGGTLALIPRTHGREILHDPKVYCDPDRFIPERFLTKDGKGLDPHVRDPSVAAFGFGRR